MANYVDDDGVSYGFVAVEYASAEARREAGERAEEAGGGGGGGDDIESTILTVTSGKWVVTATGGANADESAVRDLLGRSLSGACVSAAETA